MTRWTCCWRRRASTTRGSLDTTNSLPSSPTVNKSSFDIIIVRRDEGHFSNAGLYVFVSDAEQERRAELAVFSLHVSHGHIDAASQAW